MAENPNRPDKPPPPPPRPPENLKPTPEFQQKLDDFRAQKDAKMDSGQLADTREKKASNQVENAANREARAPQRNQDRPDPGRSGRAEPRQRPADGVGGAAPQRGAEVSRGTAGAAANERPGLRPTPEFQQKLDDFRAQKDAKMDSGQLAETREKKASNQVENAANREARAQQRNQDRPDPGRSGRAEPRQRPADGADGAAPQRGAEVSRGKEGAAANDSPSLRPTPEFQQKLDDFRAQKDAKMDSGQLADTRAKKVENQEQNAADREAKAQQRNQDRLDPGQAATGQTVVAEQTSPQQTTGAQDGTAVARAPEQSDSRTTSQDEPQVSAGGNDRNPPGGDRNPPSPPDGGDRNPPGPPGEYKGPERRQHEAQLLDPAHDLRRQGTERDVPRTTTDDPPRPGDRGFDPGEHRGELRDDFRPGTHDPEGRFDEKERRIADRLAEDGASVHPRERDDTVEGKKNPDSMVRNSPEDPGTITEFKTLDSASSNAVRRNILDAAKQVDQYGGGDVVLDGRGVNLTDEDARRGYARAVGQAKQMDLAMPGQVKIIMGDGSIKVFPEE